MKLGYTIIYVADVVATVAFYEKAFGLARRFVHESNLYAEMETGSTALAFAGEAMAEMNGVAIRPNRLGDVAAGCDIRDRRCEPPGAARRRARSASARAR